MVDLVLSSGLTSHSALAAFHLYTCIVTGQIVQFPHLDLLLGTQRHKQLGSIWTRAPGGEKPFLTSVSSEGPYVEDGVAQSVEHWTANLATRVRSPVGEEPSDLICAFLHVQMESNWAGLSVCYCRHTGKWCGTIKAVGNTDHTRQTWIHMQTPPSPLAGCGPVGEGTSGKVLNWTVRSLNHAYTTYTRAHTRRGYAGNRTRIFRSSV